VRIAVFDLAMRRGTKMGERPAIVRHVGEQRELLEDCLGKRQRSLVDDELPVFDIDCSDAIRIVAVEVTENANGLLFGGVRRKNGDATDIINPNLSFCVFCLW
jgi:hypothetical protein